MTCEALPELPETLGVAEERLCRVQWVPKYLVTQWEPRHSPRPGVRNLSAWGALDQWVEWGVVGKRRGSSTRAEVVT